jgi:GT2 family glycosyltransferase
VISVVTGTLNRADYLPALIDNTVKADKRIELVLVDGGSDDGTVPMMRNIASQESRIKFIEVGKRSSYPHYMNLGIKHASHELVCQWNDDVLLCNKWQDVFDEIDDDHDAYLFNWKTGKVKDMIDESWLKCSGMRDNGWIIINNAEYNYPEMRGEKEQEVCMNYGLYRKSVFRRYGLYNPEYRFYCADSEMAMRAYHSGVKFKTCFNIKVCVLPADKRAIMFKEDIVKHQSHCAYYVGNKDKISQVFCGEYL